uniref:Mid2 domain-containing protein n=1 Tax=Talaromyces marneffei PM1 TaxID=1077442 RepID=A0A093VUI1_TALMA
MISYQALFFFPLGLLALSAEASRQCYFPNHKLAVNDTPCTANSVSVCCQQGAACLDDGLCYLPSASAAGGFIRGSCTDQIWASQDCPQYCTDDIPGGIFNSLSDAGVVACGGTKFCCESANITTCDCQTGNGTFSLDGTISIFTTIGSSMTTTSSTNSSTTSSLTSSSTLSSVTSSASPSPATTSMTSSTISTIAASTSTVSSNGTSEVLKVGVGIGVPLGIALLVVIGVFLWRGRRKTSTLPSQVENSMPNHDNKPSAWNKPSQGETYELPFTERPRGNIYELPVR